MLFEKKIENWEDWSNVFQSKDDFKGIVQDIFDKEDLKGECIISNVTPGTNAVFKVDEYIFKIFVPLESGYDSKQDFDQETEAMLRAGKNGVKIPKIIAEGEIKDRYLFRYIVMEYIEGSEAGNFIMTCSDKEKEQIVSSLKKSLDGINIAPSEDVKIDYLKRFKENRRWDNLKSDVLNEIQDEIKRIKIEEMVFVHGDITAENALITEAGDFYIIDYADSCIAPRKYEYPPIVFDLLNCDKNLMKLFASDMDYEEFKVKVFEGTLIHQFGAFILKDLLWNHRKIKVEEIESLQEIKELMDEILKAR